MGKIKIAVTVNANINKLLGPGSQENVNASQFKHLKPSADFSLTTAPIDKEVSTSQFQSQQMFMSGEHGIGRKAFSFGQTEHKPDKSGLL